MKQRRRLLAVLPLLLSFALVAGACGGDDDTDQTSSGDEKTDETSEDSGGPSDADDDDETEDADGDEADVAPDGTFPVTIEHKYGETTVESEPTKVVTVGFTDQDFLLALDVTPIAIRDWYGDQPYATWPWAQDELGSAEPVVLPAESINFEQIDDLDPDLIVGVSSGMTEEEYETLSMIAPTLTQSGEYVDYGMPWQEGLRMVGAATGRSQSAADIIADIEAQFAEIRDTHPEFEGEATMSYVVPEGNIGAYASSDSRSQLLTELGFTIPDEIDDEAGDSFFLDISLENIEMIDRDLLVWVLSDASAADIIREHPLHDTLDVVQEGAEVFMTVEQAAAAGFNSPLSVPYLLDSFIPQLEAAMDGDPSTEVPAP